MENKESGLFSINMVSPCHKDWDKMTATEKGLFCKSCKKEVINLIGLDEKELHKAISQQPSNFCARIETKHLDSINYTPKRNWFNRIAASILIAMGLVGLSTKQSNAQVIDASKMSEDSLQKLGIKDSAYNQSNNISKIEGKIKDKITGEGIPFANIVISSNGDVFAGAQTDYNGNFIIQPLEIRDSVINISIHYLGYDSLFIKNLTLNNRNIYVDLSLQGRGFIIRDTVTMAPSTLMGAVVVSSSYSYDKPNYIPLFKSNQEESVPASVDTLTVNVKQNNINVPLGPSH